MKFRVEFDPRRCGAAGECVDVCKNGVWTWKEVESRFLGMRIRRRIPFPENQEKCTGCRKCERICPTRCVRVVEA
ncbi:MULTISPECIES: ferredoxin family protein [Archaeoglobus]|uniref:Ferredoxin (Fdx-7) n=3 Tax=Archaeoglobus fulgidus TaxID=2234 RepID=O29029_ARCFU|nr:MULTISPECIES: ferredoxin family protein [Archaeoglobus]AAB90017.1 ferredoxin (fdx-7) [Archaeoglobus fulgidus DSM 4304]AIG98110.1 Ferredoxin [Archaeoglobus fulgidus DSM 8774]KUJ93128.1 MAG: Ferredoxin (Fdx-7) [Archaeoglobus fulgidus]KUK05325.1 MAG: Ferredoxin (Fdx-7) [Archaeoglobus fulgidus]MDI3498756.1 hypothetical protein [Archaeoglobus sp.]